MNFVSTKTGLLLLVTLLGMAWQTQALESDRDQPMHLEADSLSIDDTTGVVLYEGSVEITQGSLKLWAERLWIHRREGRTEKILAEGEPVRFRQLTDNGGEEVRGEARRIEITVESDEFLMIDDAVLEQGSNSFHNDRIIYNRAKAIVRAGTSAQGKERVQVVIGPKRRTTSENGPAAATAPEEATTKVPPKQ